MDRDIYCHFTTLLLPVEAFKMSCWFYFAANLHHWHLTLTIPASRHESTKVYQCPLCVAHIELEQSLLPTLIPNLGVFFLFFFFLPRRITFYLKH